MQNEYLKDTFVKLIEYNEYTNNWTNDFIIYKKDNFNKFDELFDNPIVSNKRDNTNVIYNIEQKILSIEDDLSNK